MLYDDTGLAAWSPYGGKIQMPTMQRLADGGLTYSQWHTTALCSPTRSCFLTGRNHHQNGMACITEGSTGYPGSNAHIPPECGTLAEVMRQAGWSTFWLGKDHNVPVEELHAGATKQNWPLHQGWDRFYGFLGGETNQWYPDLTEDNHHIDQPYPPEEGYHLSKDLADNAIEMIRDMKAGSPSRPFFMRLCPGANHAPHHVPTEWADKYKGQFDDGYEAYREWVLPRMIEKGILPEGTELLPMRRQDPPGRGEHRRRPVRRPREGGGGDALPRVETGERQRAEIDRGALQAVVPSWLRHYRREWAGADAAAGLIIWSVVTPQCVAYAQIAGLPPEAGLMAAPGRDYRLRAGGPLALPRGQRDDRDLGAVGGGGRTARPWGRREVRGAVGGVR